VALSEIDRNLLERCLDRKPRAWEDFVDRFLGLVVHVVNHTAMVRNLPLVAEDRDDLCGEVFLNLIKDDFAILRHFRGQSSLATYLTVVARRVAVHQLLKSRPATPLGEGVLSQAARDEPAAQQRLEDREAVEHLIEGLDAREAEVVRLYHLEGKSYREISQATGISENTIGPVLSRARGKMRHAGVDQPAG